MFLFYSLKLTIQCICCPFWGLARPRRTRRGMDGGCRWPGISARPENPAKPIGIAECRLVRVPHYKCYFLVLFTDHLFIDGIFSYSLMIESMCNLQYSFTNIKRHESKDITFSQSLMSLLRPRSQIGSADDKYN